MSSGLGSDLEDNKSPESERSFQVCICSLGIWGTKHIFRTDKNQDSKHLKYQAIIQLNSIKIVNKNGNLDLDNQNQNQQ